MISTEQNVLMQETCPQMPEPAGCMVGVLSWWEKIAKIIFSDLAAGYVCYGMNQECDVPSPRYVISNPYIHPSVKAMNLSILTAEPLIVTFARQMPKPTWITWLKKSKLMTSSLV